MILCSINTILNKLQGIILIILTSYSGAFKIKPTFENYYACTKIDISLPH